jgi:hypothetical protein
MAEALLTRMSTPPKWGHCLLDGSRDVLLAPDVAHHGQTLAACDLDLLDGRVQGGAG